VQRHQREALRRGALYWKTGLSHALDTALEIIGIFIWQDAPLPSTIATRRILKSTVSAIAS
jgi:hypothetical protein